MSADRETLGRGHRVSIKTNAMLEYEAGRNKSKQKVASYARNKNVRAEEELLTQERVGLQSSKTAKSKSKSKESKGQPESQQAALDSEEQRNVAELKQYEARCLELKYMIYGRIGRPLAELDRMDLDELEKTWAEALQSTALNVQPALSAGAATKAKAKGSTVKDKAMVPLALETPAKKLRASKTFANKVSMIGSPLVALNQAQEQSARVEASPVVRKRIRDVSPDDEDDDGRRRCPTELVQALPKKPVTVPKPPKVIVRPAKSNPPTRESSLAPSSTSARSKLTAPKPAPKPVPKAVSRPPSNPALNLHSGSYSVHTMDIDAEQVDFGDEDENSVIDEQAHEIAGLGDQGRSEAKPRPKKNIEARLILNMCPVADEYELMIRQGWEVGVKFYGRSSNEVVLTKDINTVIKSLISSSRTRGRKRIANLLQNAFELGLSPTQTKDNVKSVAADLIPIKFHQDPEAKNEDAGHYRNPYVAQALAALFFFGSRPPGIRAGKAMKPMPVPAIAYACAISEDVLKRFAKDGYMKTEKKAKKGEGQQKRTKKAADEIVPRAGMDDVKVLMVKHLKGLASFQKALPLVFKKYRIDMYKDALSYAGRSTLDDDESKVDDGALTTASFAGEKDLTPEEYAALCSSDSDEHTETLQSSKAKPQSQPRPKALPKPTPSTAAKPHHDKPALSKIQEESGSEPESKSESEPESKSESEPESKSESGSRSESEISGGNRSPRQVLVNSLTNRLFRALDDDENKLEWGELVHEGAAGGAAITDGSGEVLESEQAVGGDVEMVDPDRDASPAVVRTRKRFSRQPLTDDEEEAIGGDEGEGIGVPSEQELETGGFANDGDPVDLVPRASSPLSPPPPTRTTRGSKAAATGMKPSMSKMQDALEKLRNVSEPAKKKGGKTAKKK
ncbi:hypothetical protein RhiJN_09121 [Ceratobasidium sp. AG-Ba]|nr:hypothetical protein RhiJN_09121 [Ceratobasidium sp. AG-Ba]